MSIEFYEHARPIRPEEFNDIVKLFDTVCDAFDSFATSFEADLEARDIDADDVTFRDIEAVHEELENNEQHTEMYKAAGSAIEKFDELWSAVDEASSSLGADRDLHTLFDESTSSLESTLERYRKAYGAYNMLIEFCRGNIHDVEPAVNALEIADQMHVVVSDDVRQYVNGMAQLAEGK